MRAHGEQAMLLLYSSLPSPDGLISTMHGEDGEFFGSTRDKGGNSNAILPMTTVASVPPFHSGGTPAERQASGAAGSRRRAQRGVGCTPSPSGRNTARMTLGGEFPTLALSL